MSRIFATQAGILEAIRDRLIDKIPEMSDGNCFISDEPMPLKAPPADIFITLAPTDGTFPEGFFAGGGEQTLTEHAGLFITIFVRSLLDPVGRAHHALLNPDRGLLHLKRDVLSALFKNSWEPEDAGGPFLRDQLNPINSVSPKVWQPEGAGSYLYTGLTLGTNWDWEL